MVRQYIKPVPTPRSTFNVVLETIRREESAHEPAFLNWLSGLIAPRIAIPAVAGGLVAVLFFLVVSTRTGPGYDNTAHTASNDIIHLSFENFARLQSGTMQPEMVATVPESVGDFLRDRNLQFGVHVPRLQKFDWCGGSSSECSGVKQAHLLFKMGDELIYVCEMSDDDALYGTRVSLPLAAKRALTQSGWYTDPDHPNCNVVLWKTDEAVCVAVSTMKKGELLALLTMQ